ncbi:hypothetical protein [Desulfovibrio sp. Fe33]|uniref:hypothetical protein n=1 Tax=Desulfovibrio sp. Fe33 TaxID=3020842 RepID=UPI00234C5405|nr:hypothetical protein [Desulfovibrio sp. Fe33]
MNGVAPMGPASEHWSGREEPAERIIPSERTSDDVKTPAEVQADAVAQAEKTTLNDFRYTGKGSFIDKVF